MTFVQLEERQSLFQSIISHETNFNLGERCFIRRPSVSFSAVVLFIVYINLSDSTQ